MSSELVVIDLHLLIWMKSSIWCIIYFGQIDIVYDENKNLFNCKKHCNQQNYISEPKITSILFSFLKLQMG